jgi:hypothetical protein
VYIELMEGLFILDPRFFFFFPTMRAAAAAAK